MSRASYTLYIIIATLILAACQGESKYHSRLRALDSVLVQSPDSVYKVLVAEEKEAQQQSRSDRMYYELLRADAQNKAYIDFTTDSIMKEVADYYDHHGTANQQMRAHYLLGCTYRDLGNSPRALNCYMDAVAKADTTDQRNYHLLMITHSQMADIYDKQSLTEQERVETVAAEEYAWKANDTISAMVHKETYAKILFLEGKTEESIQLCKAIYNKYMELGLEDYAGMSCWTIINIFIKNKNFQEAEQYLAKYEQAISKPNSNIQPESGQSALFAFKATLSLENEETDSAEFYFRKALSENYYYNSSQGLYGLTKVFEKKNLPDSVIKYSILYEKSRKSEFDKLQTKACTEAKQLYNYISEQKIAEAERKSKEHNKSIVYFLCILLAFMIVTTMYVRLHWKKRHEDAISELKYLHQRDINALRLAEQQLHNTQLEKAHLEEYRAIKENEIIDLSNKIQNYEKTLFAISTRGKGIELKESFIIKRFNDYLLHGNSPTDDDWQQLTELVEKVHPHFYTIMNRYTTLSEKEYFVCLLVKCGFAPGEIDILLNMPQSSASTMRQRLHKKVFGEVGKSVEFDKKVRMID